MQATAELQVIPIGSGVSVRSEVKQVVNMLSEFNLTLETHASGTNIEGELDIILAATTKVHEFLHQSGVVRIVSYLKLETRTDKIPTLSGKRL
ncbi:MAG: MTH1187 family thiamine-binding protein [Gammaproteobacteria bacterium]|nr:MTH1187 family thiamine-binding protein [Gammaproteobacteria bacterium]